MNRKRRFLWWLYRQFIQKWNIRLLVFVDFVLQPHQVLFQDLNLTFVARKKKKSWFLKRKTYRH